MDSTNSTREEGLSRRAFVGASAFAAAAMGLAGCAPRQSETKLVETGVEQESIKDVELDPEKEGKWVPAPCWHNCGGRCLNLAYVVDGVVVRQKTDDSHEDSVEWPQQRSCLRGHSQRTQCFGPDRIKYPMKRKNWEPLTGGKKELRGRDEWERITWDEAFAYIAAELKNAIDKYGNRSILAPGLITGGPTTGVAAKDGDNGDMLLSALGGYTACWDSASLGSNVCPLKTFGINGARRNGNDRFDMYNADYVVLYGANPSWSGLGSTSWLLKNAQKRGVKFVIVDPTYNATGQMLDAEWIPVVPGTDTAMLLGVAYQMIQDGTIDQEFLDKYTVGFDGEHMPSDAKLTENFKDYVLGAYDETPKTPEWASERSGTPVEKIKRLAEIFGKQNNTMLMFGFAPSRTYGSWNLPQLFMTISAMGGHIGKSGNCCSVGQENYAGYGGKPLYKQADPSLPALENPVKDIVPGPLVWDAVVEGKYIRNGDPRFGGLQPAEEVEIDIHVICNNQMGNFLENGTGTRKGIEALRKVDFVVSRGIYLNANCRFSDIVLPVTTKWEGNYTTLDGKGNTENLFFYSNITVPLFEAKTDQEINKGILEAMGVDPSICYPMSEKAQYFNDFLNSMVINETGDDYEKMVTITQEDIDEWGVEEEMKAAGFACAPQTGKIALKDLLARGVYQVKRSEGDAYSSFVEYGDFYADPEANPVPSASGKFEIYCQAKADILNAAALGGEQVKPYPDYVEPKSGYAMTFKDAAIGGEKSEYPYVLFSPHYLRRAHSNYDNIPWLREEMASPVFISSVDADEKGVKTGDTVVVYSSYGRVLRQVSVMPWLMPGVVGLPHGGLVDYDDESDVERSGEANMLVGPIRSDFGVSGYNNGNCNFELYDGEPLVPDWQKPLVTFED